MELVSGIQVASNTFKALLDLSVLAYMLANIGPRETGAVEPMEGATDVSAARRNDQNRAVYGVLGIHLVLFRQALRPYRRLLWCNRWRLPCDDLGVLFFSPWSVIGAGGETGLLALHEILVKEP